MSGYPSGAQHAQYRELPPLPCCDRKAVAQTARQACLALLLDSLPALAGYKRQHFGAGLGLGVVESAWLAQVGTPHSAAVAPP